MTSFGIESSFASRASSTSPDVGLLVEDRHDDGEHLGRVRRHLLERRHPRAEGQPHGRRAERRSVEEAAHHAAGAEPVDDVRPRVSGRAPRVADQAQPAPVHQPGQVVGVEVHRLPGEESSPVTAQDAGGSGADVVEDHDDERTVREGRRQLPHDGGAQWARLEELVQDQDAGVGRDRREDRRHVAVAAESLGIVGREADDLPARAPTDGHPFVDRAPGKDDLPGGVATQRLVPLGDRPHHLLELLPEQLPIPGAVVLTDGVDVEVVPVGDDGRVGVHDATRPAPHEPHAQLVEEVPLIVRLAGWAGDERCPGARREHRARRHELEPPRGALLFGHVSGSRSPRGAEVQDPVGQRADGMGYDSGRIASRGNPDVVRATSNHGIMTMCSSTLNDTTVSKPGGEQIRIGPPTTCSSDAAARASRWARRRTDPRGGGRGWPPVRRGRDRSRDARSDPTSSRCRPRPRAFVHGSRRRCARRSHS